MGRAVKNKMIEKYHKRFANGEQNIELDLHNRKIIKITRDYYWQEEGVYNRILPIIKSTARDLTDKQLYGENGLVALLIPYQRAYNAVKNREMEYINRQSMGVLCVEDGSVDLDDITEEGIGPGKVIVYRQGSHCPTFQTSSLDTRAYRETSDHILNEMKSIAIAYCSDKGNKS